MAQTRVLVAAAAVAAMGYLVNGQSFDIFDQGLLSVPLRTLQKLGLSNHHASGSEIPAVGGSHANGQTYLGLPLWQLSIIGSLVISTILSFFSLGHMLLLEKWTDYLYFDKKILKRRYALGKMTDARRVLGENFGDIFCLALTPTFVLSYLAVPVIAANGIDFSFRFLHVVIGTIILYLSFDIGYYAMHRTFHENKTLYRMIHKRHHVDMPVHIFLTLKANYLENVLAVSPGVTVWVAFAMYTVCAEVFNVWTIVLPLLTLVMEFNTGHTGYQDHVLLYVMSPLQWFVKALPGSRWMAQDHEEHHVSLKKNYGPFFWIWDYLGGTNAFVDASKFQTVDHYPKDLAISEERSGKVASE